MHLGYNEECFRVTTEDVAEVLYLGCNHEEANTRILLHPKNVSKSKYTAFIICKDPDVFSLQKQLPRSVL